MSDELDQRPLGEQLLDDPVEAAVVEALADRDHWKARAETAEVAAANTRHAQRINEASLLGQLSALRDLEQAARAWRAARTLSMTGDTWDSAVATHRGLAAAVDALPAEETPK